VRKQYRISAAADSGKKGTYFGKKKGNGAAIAESFWLFGRNEEGL